MPLRSALLACAATLLAATACMAQTATFAGSFDLVAAGRKVGHDTYKIGPDKHGVKLTSNYSFSDKGQEGQYATEFRFGDGYQFENGSSENMGNPIHYGFTPNKEFTELTVSTAQGGGASTSILTIKPNLVVLPNFDAGAAQAVLLQALTHPTADNHYSVFVPGANRAAGSRGGHNAAPSPDDATAANSALPPSDSAFDAIWVKGNTIHGTLDGKPVDVHLYAMAFGQFRWIFMADDQNNLLQCNVSLLRVNYVRSKFKLDEPTATAAPSQTAR